MNIDTRTYTIKVESCPLCNGKWRFYDGALGYENLVCKNCNFDIQEIKIEGVNV